MQTLGFPCWVQAKDDAQRVIFSKPVSRGLFVFRVFLTQLLISLPLLWLPTNDARPETEESPEVLFVLVFPFFALFIAIRFC